MARAAVVDATYGFAQNGVSSMVQTSSSEWLKTAPRGAYTTARTVNQDSVFELTFHIERLAETARLMGEADAEAAGIPAQLTNAEQLRPLVLETLRAAVTSFRTAHPNHDGEMRLTMLAHWENGVPNVAAHVAAMPARAQPPVKVQVKGEPRSNAAAKDSEWVRERQSLEAEKPADVNEIVLVNKDGSMFEGLSSNFFAIMDGKLYTAGEGILLGTVRHIILKVCDREGIPVELSPPNVADVDRWEGCIVSSTSRLSLPVNEIEVFNGDGSTVHMFSDDGIVHRLDKLVMDEIEAASEPL